VVVVTSKNSIHHMWLSEKSDTDSQSQLSDGDSTDECKVYVQQTKQEPFM